MQKYKELETAINFRIDVMQSMKFQNVGVLPWQWFINYCSY